MKVANDRKTKHRKQAVRPRAKFAPAILESRVLILAPTGNDASLTANFLAKAKLTARVCRDVPQLCAKIGQGCGTILLAEETLGLNSISVLLQLLVAQPSWSDIPIILITSGGEVSQTRLRRLTTFAPGGNVTLLERPFRPATLTSAVEVALRARQRQYQVRELMDNLSDARARIEATLEVADVGTWTWDIQHDRIFADKNVARLFSAKKGDAAGGSIQKYFAAIHPEDRARVQSAVEAALHNENGQFEMDYRLVQGDNSVRWVTSRGKVERDDTGQAVRLPGVTIDITARKRAEDMLRQNEGLFAALVEQAPNGVYVVDSQFRLQQVNARALPTFDRVAAPIGRDFAEVMRILWGPKVGEEVADIFRHTLATGEPYHSERFSERRHDLDVDEAYEWETQRVTLPDGQHGVVCYFKNITERQRAEASLLEAKAAAEAANRAKDDFLAALSHELRTPLNPALLIASESADNHQLPEAVRLNFEIILKSIELEARLIDDLLDLTRVTSGKLSLSKRPVEVHALLKDAIATVQAEQQEKRIQLSLKLAAQKFWVEGDAVRLQQVFWNVLKNAVKFTPPGGDIAVETRDDNNGWLVIKISDSGMGMNPDELDRVFSAFVQGDHAGSASSHRFGGLGLGLAISKNLVELHAGKIRAESAGRDCGSSFIIELPLTEQEGNAPAAEKSTPNLSQQNTSGTRILLVEDHEPTRAALAHLLVRRHCDVKPAASLSEARALAEQYPFDLLISDIGLPDGNGFDLMSELRTTNKALRGIALTGYGMEEDIARSRNAGFVSHLVKPIRVQALEAALATAMPSPS